MISIVYLLAYIFIAQLVINKIQIRWFRIFLGPIFGGILLGVMKAGIVPNSWLSALVVFPGALYLIFLPSRLETKNR
jgi:hypothetical protein